MSQENVEVHRRGDEAFNTRDVENFIALFDPNIEFHTEFSAVGGVYHGHDGLRKFLRDFEDAWGGEIRLEPEAYFDLGQHTLAFHVRDRKVTRISPTSTASARFPTSASRSRRCRGRTWRSCAACTDPS